MTKRIEEIKVGDKFMKGDWEVEVNCIELDDTDFQIGVAIAGWESDLQCFYLTKSQAEAIDTWIEDTSISQAAADVILKEFNDTFTGNFKFRRFIQSLVKK